jgi:hypothetical protein
MLSMQNKLKLGAQVWNAASNNDTCIIANGCKLHFLKSKTITKNEIFPKALLCVHKKSADDSWVDGEWNTSRKDALEL